MGSVGKCAQNDDDYAPAAPSDPHVVWFSIIDWGGQSSPRADSVAYPEWAPVPQGPFTFLSIDDREAYVDNRKAGGAAQDAMHRGDVSLEDKEIHHVHPIWLGGSPTDPENLLPLTHEQHVEIERFWSRMRADLRDQWHGGRK